MWSAILLLAVCIVAYTIGFTGGLGSIYTLNTHTHTPHTRSVATHEEKLLFYRVLMVEYVNQYPPCMRRFGQIQLQLIILDGFWCQHSGCFYTLMVEQKGFMWAIIFMIWTFCFSFCKCCITTCPGMHATRSLWKHLLNTTLNIPVQMCAHPGGSTPGLWHHCQWCPSYTVVVTTKALSNIYWNLISYAGDFWMESCCKHASHGCSVKRVGWRPSYDMAVAIKSVTCQYCFIVYTCA